MSFLKGIKTEIEMNCVAEIQGDLDKVERVPFIIRFKKLTVNEARDLFERSARGEISDEDILRQHIVTWRKMPGLEPGSEVEFSAEALEQALSELGYRNALVDAFTQAQLGKKGALRKNS